MRALRNAAIALLVGLLIAVPLLAWLCSADAPTVARSAPPAAADIERAGQLLQQWLQQRDSASTLHTATLSERDLALLIEQVARRSATDALAEVRLAPGRAQLRASIAVAGNPFGRWLNIDAALVQRGGLPLIEQLRIGRVALPSALAHWLARAAAERLLGDTRQRLARDMLRSVQFGPGRVALVIDWRADTADRLLAELLPLAEQQRLKAYADALADWGRGKAQASVSLTQLLPPMFALARQRSEAGEDAVRENRAALLTLAFAANGRGLAAIVPAARRWPPPPAMQITLAGRDDFPQHLLTSAVIAMEGGGTLANAMGVYKEVADARGGSGFSFNDIAADRAGTRLGLRAVRQPRELQAALAAGIAEPALMPRVDDLPEFLSQAEFVQRYGGVGAPAYQQMLAEIEARLDAMALYR